MEGWERRTSRSRCIRHNGQGAGGPRHVDSERRRGINAGVRALRAAWQPGRWRPQVSLNCYATGPGTKVAAPPHADAQGVLVLQTVAVSAGASGTPCPSMLRAEYKVDGGQRGSVSLWENHSSTFY